MKGFLITLVVTSIAIVIVSYILPEFRFKNASDHIPQVIILALIIGVVNSLIKPVVGLLSFPVNAMTLGLFGVVVNGLLLLLVAYVAQHLVQRAVHDRRVPGLGPVGERLRVGDHRVDRDGHHHGRHRARRPRLSDLSRPVRAAPSGRSPIRHPGLRHLGRRARRRRRDAARRLPRPVAARLLGQGQRRARDRRATRCGRAGRQRRLVRRMGRGAGRRDPATTGSRSRASARPRPTCGRPCARRSMAGRCGGSRSRAPRSSRSWARSPLGPGWAAGDNPRSTSSSA